MSQAGFVPDAFPPARTPKRVARDWVPVLRGLPLFEGVSQRHLRRIEARSKQYAPGETIVREGDPGNSFYVILEGSVSVRPPGRRAITLKVGDYFGEMALLDGAPRSADILAVVPVTVLVVGRPAFAKLVREEPRIAEAMLRTLASRLRSAQTQY